MPPALRPAAGEAAGCPAGLPVQRLLLPAAAGRLRLIPAAVLLGCRLCGAESLVTGVSVVLAAMPMGGVTAVLAEKYGGDSAFASKCVAVSTVLSLITTPLWCMVV